MKSKKVWCEENDVEIGLLGFPRNPTFRSNLKKYTSLIRCKKCKKRFRGFIRECHDINCWHAYLPKHKRALKKSV